MSSNTIENQAILIKVKTVYLEERSQPENQRFAFAYTISIENNSEQPAQLINRHWIITDTNNNVQDVKGSGVIGQQPRILPGENFSYTSASVIETPAGTMEGSYEMQSDEGELFTVEIPAFSLTRPEALH